MASSSALFTCEELLVMRNAVSWKEDEELAQKAAQLEAELAQKTAQLEAEMAQNLLELSQKRAQLEARKASVKEAALRV